MGSGVAVGAGRQSMVAYINISCYYIIGVPIGVILGYVFHLEIKVRRSSFLARVMMMHLN